MRSHLLVLVGSTVLVPSVLSAAGAWPQHREDRRMSAGAARGIRTDRLSGRALETWNAIVKVAMAEDAGGRPLHPTLRALWDAVDASGRAVFVELPEPKGRRPYIVGQFAITKVDPAGRALEGVLVVNPPAIDRASTGPGAARKDGFIPFAELGKWERYAEVLGHELAHAAWSFGDADRTRLIMTLPGEVEQLSRRILAAKGEAVGEEPLEQARRLDRLNRQIEEPAEAAEEAVWAELRASQRAR